MKARPDARKNVQVSPVVAVVDDSGMLPERPVSTNPVGSERVLDGDVAVHTVECIGQERRVLCAQRLVDTDASDSLQVRTGDGANAVDPALKRREAAL